MKICIVLGTRPEIIKFSPVIRECERLGLDFDILHTGQHYSYNMDRVFFDQLELPKVAGNLDVGSGYHGEQTGKILMGVEKVLQREAPDVVLVEGDSVVGDTSLVFLDKDNNIRVLTIEEFSNLNFPKDLVSDFKESVDVLGWKVLSLDSKGNSCFKKVNSVIRHRLSKQLYRVRTLESEVVVTKDHSLFTLNSEKMVEAKPENLTGHLLVDKPPMVEVDPSVLLLKDNLLYPEKWKYLFLYVPKKIKVDPGLLSNSRDTKKNYTNDYNRIEISKAVSLDLDRDLLSKSFIANHQLKNNYQIKPFLEMSEELCWILGFYMAEGSLIEKPDNSRQIYLYNADMSLLVKIKNWLETIFDIILPEPKYYESAKTGRLILPLVLVYVFLEIFNVGVKEKKQVPSIIFGLPKRFKERFLEGYMAGDAYLKEMEITTKSKTVLDSLVFLLRTMGITYTIKFNRYKGRRKNIHCLKILPDGKHGHNNKGKVYSEKPFNDAKNLEIKETLPIEGHSVVYDLSVEDTERFVSAHGVVLHNTNTVVAGALAAVKLGIKVGHVEAGLRSYDRSMPEEINRIVCDHISDFLFAPTWMSAGILQAEGVPESTIFVTGNTIVDAVEQNLKIAKGKAKYPEEVKVKKGNYLIATAHRQENVDNKVRFKGILTGLRRVQKEFDLPLIYPVHPRSRGKMRDFDLKTEGLTLVEPLDYLAFLKLLSECKLTLTDSGGLQEESCILKVPCVTLRDNTERPETLQVGSNKIAGTNPAKILEIAKEMVGVSRDWVNPFGDGNAAGRIVKVLREHLE